MYSDFSRHCIPSTIKPRIFKESSHLNVQKFFFLRNISTSSVSCIYMYMTKNCFAIRFWFKVNCLIFMSYDGLEYYLIFRSCLRPSAFFYKTNIIKKCTYDNFCVIMIKYIMYNIPVHNIIYNNAVRPVL